MDIQRAVSDFMSQGDELLSRLRSTEGGMLSEVELQNLRVCLDQIGMEATNRQHIKLIDPQRLLRGAQ